jgi:hypothetical protein
MVDARSKPKSPAEIVNAPDMTQRQKIEVLDSWALDIERRLASTDEGMPGQGEDDTDLTLLDQIHDAKRLLEPGSLTVSTKT